MGTKLAIRDYVPSQRSPVSDVECRVVPMYNTASLIIGTLTDQCGEVPHLTGLQMMHLNNGKELNDGREDSLMVAGMYRLFGWDTTADVGRKSREVNTWAASETCVIDPTSLYATDDADEPYRLIYCTRRKGRSSTMPPLDILRHTGKATLVITQPSIAYKITGSRISEARETIIKRPITKFPVIKVSAQSVIRVHHLQARSDKTEAISAKREKDFQQDADDPPPILGKDTARVGQNIADNTVNSEPVPSVIQQPEQVTT